MKTTGTILLFIFLLSSHAHSQEETLDPVQVSGAREISDNYLGTFPGVHENTGGGLSPLPTIHGLADDRLNIRIDEAIITSSCPNHMNPVLSYIDSSKIESVQVMAGITPVSHGGDSIGGTILVKSKKLKFEQQSLELKTHYKSNNENRGAALTYELADDKNFFGYAGFEETAENYRDGGGERIRSTLYNQNNQTLTFGRKLKSGVLALRLNRAVVPYEGFVNQYMDLEDNVTNRGTLNYDGQLGEVILNTTVFHQHTNHFMDIIQSQRKGSMPMNTRSDESGANVKGSIERGIHFYTTGLEYVQYRLYDWWPPLKGSMMMGPNTYESINNGKRDRLGAFIEAESRWSTDFSTNLGLRTDLVTMNTGDVQGYNNTNNLPADAEDFNSRSHKREDHNFDATLSSSYKLNKTFDWEIGVARKSRSPNIYERYAWAGAVTDPSGSMSAGMDASMINWFGDGNGYVGNLDLKPEVAHTLSTSIKAHGQSWEAKLTPYYTDVNNFIDADFIGSSMGGNFLRFANHDAVLFGADFQGGIVFKDLRLTAISSYVRGYRKDGKANLYHLMPLNGKITLEYVQEKWTSGVAAQLVNKKAQVNELRNEPETAGYALLDLNASYVLSKLLKLELNVLNLLDHHYELPLGGLNLIQGGALTGMGRSINTNLTWNFL